MSKYLGYEQTGFANSTVSITRATSVDTAGINYSNTVFTTLYLPFNDDVNDDSPFSQTITNRGSMTVDSTYTKFGSNALKSQNGGSLKIDNSTSTDLDGSFTVEFFLYVVTHDTNKAIYTHNEINESYQGILFWFGGSGVLRGYGSSNGSSWNIFHGNSKHFGTVSTGAWHHVAITYDGTTYRGYLDGSLKWSQTSSTTIPTGGHHYIFARNEAGQYTPSTGSHYMDDFRITKGKALYTDSTYTVPTSALGIQQEDPVSLYLPFDSDIQDDSTHAHTVTAAGSATISSTQSKFGGNSLSLNGTDQYLTFPNHSTFQFGTEDFTIEAWIYQSTAAGSDASDRHNVVSRMESSSNRSWSLDIRNETQQKIVFGFTSNGTNSTEIKFDCDVPVGSWHHVAIVRSHNNLYAFLDGISLSGVVTGHLSSFSSSVDFYAGTSDLTVGHRGLSNQFFEGYIDDLRISKGVARYTKHFIPPSQAVGATLNGENETITTTDFTTLYLPFDSDLQDDSSSSHSVTATGGAAISSAQSKFGGYSALFDGTNDYLSIPSSSDFNFDSDFTIECFIYPNNNNNYMLISHRASSVNFTLEMHRNTTGDIEFFAGSFSGTNPVISTTISGGFTGAWHHVAVTRIGDVFRLFFDGELKNTVTQSSVTFNTSAELRIGADNHPTIGSRFFFNGYIDDFRILTGYAKYTADFVPPTTAVTTSVSETENDLTVLYMPFDGDVSTSSIASSLYLPFDSDLNDDSSNASTGTASGGAAISSTQSKFGGYSLYLDGSNDYVTYDNLALGTDDFTIEAFIYDTKGSAYREIVNNYHSSANGGWLLRLSSSGTGRLSFAWRASGSWQSIGASTNVVSQNTWHHIAAVRSSDTLTLYVDGVSVASGSVSSLDAIDAAIQLGSYSSGSGQWFQGYIDDLRIIKGTAIYTGNFAPPTTALGASETTDTIEGGFEDLARNHGVTKEGDTVLKTSVKKFGTSSVYFDGTGDRVLVKHGGELNLSDGDFTIEGWFYFTSNATARIFHGEEGSGTYSPWLFYTTSAGAIQFYASSNYASWDVVSAASLGTVSLNTWTHLAVTRERDVFRCFQDGVLKSTTRSSSSLYYNTDNQIAIGGRSGTNYMAGYADDLRIIKGKAIYTEAFTPPASAHGHNSLTESQTTSESYSDTKFLSGVWDIRDAESKIQDGEWIRNDSDTGSVPSGLTIKGAGLEVDGHRWYVAPTNAPGVEILAVGAGGDGGNNNKSGGNTVFTHSGTGEYILAVGGGGAGPAGGGVGRSGGGGGGFVSATDLILDKDVSYTLTVGASGIAQNPLPGPSPAHPGGSGGGGTYVGGGVSRAGGTGVQPSTPQPLISGIPGASNFQNIGYNGGSHPPNSDNPGRDNGPGRGGGGQGTTSTITGSSISYAGGGFSGNRGGPTEYTGNSGPGGNGNSGPGNGGPGTRGGGGGGAGASGPTGGSGGPGVFVIAYPDSENALSITGTLSYGQPSRSGYRVYYFTSGTGTITLSG